MRLLYSFVWYIALPFVLLRLWIRGKKEPGYRQHIGERLGLYGKHSVTTQRYLWVHAVSVGETRAAEPLITGLLKQYPQHTILLTQMTATGRATGALLFGHNPRVERCFLPYDTLCMTKRFLQHFRPDIGILMETEVWPNLIHQCHLLHVPIMLANARLSEKSLRQGRRMGSLLTQAGKELSFVAAQTESDAERLRQFGAEQVAVTGSLKFDVPLPASLLALGHEWKKAIGNRPVLLCASTRDGEEALLLEVFDHIPEHWLVVIVPRHPQRFDEVAQLCDAAHLKVQRRSQWQGDVLGDDVRVMLGDSMGEMVAYYALADLSFIGGSLLPLGGQNLIEACAVGSPVLLGPHTFNFDESSRNAIRLGAAVRVQNNMELVHAARDIIDNPERLAMMAQAAKRFATAYQGATHKTIALIGRIVHT